MKNRFENLKYLNWLRISLVLIYAKEGLENFTEQEVGNFHKLLKSTISHSRGPTRSTNWETCSACLRSDIKKQWSRGVFQCLMNICNQWLKGLYSYLVSLSVQVEWDNVETSQFPCSPLECVKLFMPYGCQGVSSVQEFDLAVFLTLYLNCTHFHKFIANPALCGEIKDIRNRIMHSGTMEVDTDDMERDVQKIKCLLKDPKYFLNDPNCQEAVERIDKLMDGSLEVSLGKDKEMLVINTTLKEIGGKISQLWDKQKKYDEDLHILICDNNLSKGGNQQIHSEIGKLKQDLTQVKSLADRFFTFLAENTIDGIDTSSMTTNKSRLAAIQTKLRDHDEILKDHEQKLSQHRQELDEHQESLSQNKQEIYSIMQNSTQQQQTLGEHVQILTEQGKSIETLHMQQQQHTKEQGMYKKRLDYIERKVEQGKSYNQPKDIPEDKLCDLQKYLVDYYKDICLWVQNPILPEEEVRLEDIHVNPDIHVLRERSDHSELKVVSHGKASELSYKQIFCTDSYKCKQIYVTGDAGSGKSMFCKSLINDWCQAHDETVTGSVDNTEALNDEDTEPGYHLYHKRRHVQQRADRQEKKREHVEMMKEFRFLFYITLRDSVSEYNIKEMIYSQILQHDPNMRQLDLERILRQEKCLILLDGLDEWVCPDEKSRTHFMNPGIPGRDRLNKNNVIITTTRPWKFDVLQLKTSEHDKHVKLCGLGEISAKLLSSKIIKLLNRCHDSNRDVKDFLELLRCKCLGHFETVPVILTQLVCLWFDEKGIGESQTQIYCSMLDLLLDRSKKHFTTEAFTNVSSLPSCFDEKESCQLNKQLIQCLSKLAFESLFNENKEESLVFPYSKAEPYGISKVDIDLCLKCGILSQNKVLGRSSRRMKKLSFLHKKVQEFLAAVYIANCEDFETVLGKVKGICLSLDSCLEFSKVWEFVSGIKPALASQLLQHFAFKIETDSRVLTYRQTPNPDVLTSLIEHTQTCFSRCMSEAIKNGHHAKDLNLVFEDFVLSKNTVSNDLEKVLKHNCMTAKSIYINTKDMNTDKREKVGQILNHLDSMQMLQKLHLADIDGVISIGNILNTVKNCKTSITCLVLWQVQLNTMVGLFSPLCQTLVSLRSFRLEHVTFTHEQILGLLMFVSKHVLQDLRLWWLECSDHKNGSQCACKLDLLPLSELQTLQLSHMEVDNLHALCNSIQSLVLSLVEFSATTWKRFIHGLSEMSHSLDVELRWVSIKQDGDELPNLKEDLEKLGKFNITQSQNSGKAFYITFSSK